MYIASSFYTSAPDKFSFITPCTISLLESSINVSFPAVWHEASVITLSIAFLESSTSLSAIIETSIIAVLTTLVVQISFIVASSSALLAQYVVHRVLWFVKQLFASRLDMLWPVRIAISISKRTSVAWRTYPPLLICSILNSRWRCACMCCIIRATLDTMQRSACGSFGAPLICKPLIEIAGASALSSDECTGADRVAPSGPFPCPWPRPCPRLRTFSRPRLYPGAHGPPLPRIMAKLEQGGTPG